MRTILGSDIHFTRVSPDYLKAQIVSSLIGWGIFFIAAIATGIISTIFDASTVAGIAWIIAGIIVICLIWDLVWTARQIKVMGYAELPEELAIRRGIMFQKLVLVPYGRMQQVNVETGPLLSRWKLANVELVTASADTNATIPGLPLAEAERLRAQLTSLGGAQMEGL